MLGWVVRHTVQILIQNQTMKEIKRCIQEEAIYASALDGISNNLISQNCWDDSLFFCFIVLLLTHCGITTWHRSGSSIITYCRTVPSHYLKQCGAIINKGRPVPFIWGPFCKRYHSLAKIIAFKNYLLKIWFKSHRDQWVAHLYVWGLQYRKSKTAAGKTIRMKYTLI